MIKAGVAFPGLLNNISLCLVVRILLSKAVARLALLLRLQQRRRRFRECFFGRKIAGLDGNILVGGLVGGARIIIGVVVTKLVGCFIVGTIGKVGIAFLGRSLDAALEAFGLVIQTIRLF